MNLKEWRGVVKLNMRRARAQAKRSRSRVVQVGAVVTEYAGRAVGYGYNGIGHTGVLEDIDPKDGSYITKPGVVHAEVAAIGYAAREHMLDGAILYVTTSPCFDCANLILWAGIDCVFYEHDWWDKAPVEYLRKHGVMVHKYKQYLKEYTDEVHSRLP